MPRLSELSLGEIIALHLDGPQSSFPAAYDDFFIASTLTEIVREATSAAAKEYSSPVLPAIGYMAALDQLGNCYDVTGVTCDYKNGIKRALALFGGLGREEIKILYGLRNALVHNVSLLHISDRSDSPSMGFTIHDFPSKVIHETQSAIISAPTENWDGELTNLSETHFAKISLQGLRDLVSASISCAKDLLQKGRIEMNLDHTKTNTDKQHKDFIIMKCLLLVPRR